MKVAGEKSRNSDAVRNLSMATPNADSGCQRRAQTHPAWLTEELIDATLKVWQPYYDAPLTREDAIEMILVAGRLMRAFSATR
jgi:hypothetical protein